MTGHTEGLLPLSSGGAGIQGALRSNSKLPHSYPGRGEAQGPRCPRKAPPFLSLTSDKEKRIFLSASLFHSGVLCSSFSASTSSCWLCIGFPRTLLHIPHLLPVGVSAQSWSFFFPPFSPSWSCPFAEVKPSFLVFLLFSRGHFSPWQV